MTAIQEPDNITNAAKEITVSVGASRREKKWKPKQYAWGAFLDLLAQPVTTKETYAEYMHMARDRQSEIKDVGGFIGGTLKGGRRQKGSVAWRQLITLDADHIAGDLWGTIELFTDYAVAIYSTHKHSNEEPRYRIIIPLAEPVQADQYEPIARMIARELGIEYFDATTYQAHRLMYWPSHSLDADYLFDYRDGDWIDGQSVLDSYQGIGLDWTDPLHWPRSAAENEKHIRMVDKAEDPREKVGPIGAFCRSYTIPDAIDTFIPQEYNLNRDGRYTYKDASSSGGLVLYEDGLFGYSHHESDPAGGQLSNAFDLVRIHKFKELDTDLSVPFNRRPSHKAMLDLASKDDNVKRELFAQKERETLDDFSSPIPEEADTPDKDWALSLRVNRSGVCEQTIDNVLMILENDPGLRGRIKYNEFSSQLVILRELPWHNLKAPAGDQWSDTDDACLRHYMERRWEITLAAKIADGLTTLSKRHRFHPVRDYLNEQIWDGSPRVEKIFVDYLGAQDTEYVRTVTRKALVGAVARIMKPGCKFDYMPVLFGSQGIGKSHIIKLLAGAWYSDSVTTVQGKEAYEQLQDAWIIEMAELSATKRAESESIKHFISKSEDSYRAAYAKRSVRYPRQCVFIGTTNDETFLKDRTGNRRYWPIALDPETKTKDLFKELDPDEVAQIWAEAVDLYNAGEELFLTSTTAAEALEKQREHMEEDLKEGQIREFLDMLLPPDWEDMTIHARRSFIAGDYDELGPKATIKRDKICAAEIMSELFRKDLGNVKSYETKEVNSILARVSNWEVAKGSRGRLRFGNMYGLQRAYTRKIVSTSKSEMDTP